MSIYDDDEYPDLDLEVECTCVDCSDADDCVYAFSPENINGVCINIEGMK